MNRCPKCENENLKEEYNYCPVCGLLISQDHRETVISNLRIIRDGFKEMECYDSEAEETKLVSISSLDIAIRELKRTAPEVPVQEQPTREIFSQLQILLVTASSIVRKALENTIND